MIEIMAARAASAVLRQCWAEGRKLDDLPQAVRPGSRADGYVIQSLLEAESAAPLFGWKIAATSREGQAHIGVSGPLAGRILKEKVIAPGGDCSMAGNGMQVAEFEFAFVLGRDLAPRAEAYDRAGVLDAVASLHPAIEIPDSRFVAFERAGEAQLIADNACAHQFVLGDAAPATWRHIDLAAHQVAARVGTRIGTGIGKNVLGDPRDALVWIVRELTGMGVTLRAGQSITTGTCLAPMAIAPGDAVFGDFGELGTVSVHMVG